MKYSVVSKGSKLFVSCCCVSLLVLVETWKESLTFKRNEGEKMNWYELNSIKKELGRWWKVSHSQSPWRGALWVWSMQSPPPPVVLAMGPEPSFWPLLTQKIELCCNILGTFSVIVHLLFSAPPVHKISFTNWNKSVSTPQISLPWKGERKRWWFGPAEYYFSVLWFWHWSYNGWWRWSWLLFCPWQEFSCWWLFLSFVSLASSFFLPEIILFVHSIPIYCLFHLMHSPSICQFKAKRKLYSHPSELFLFYVFVTSLAMRNRRSFITGKEIMLS